MKLSLLEIIRPLEYWASYYAARSKFEKHELMNIAFLGRIQDLEDPNLASRCIRCDLLNFLKRASKRQMVSIESFDMFAAKVKDAFVAIEKVELLDNVMEIADLTEIERSVIFQYFYLGNQLAAIGVQLKLCESRISQILNGALIKLREAYNAFDTGE